MPNYENAIFHSDLNAFKNLFSGDTSVTPTGTTSANTTKIWSSDITHNENRPLPFQVYYRTAISPERWTLCPKGGEQLNMTSGSDFVTLTGIMTDTQLKVSVIHSETNGINMTAAGTDTFHFKYFIFLD